MDNNMLNLLTFLCTVSLCNSNKKKNHTHCSPRKAMKVYFIKITSVLI